MNRLLAALCLAAASGVSQAAALRYCDPPAPLNAAQKDRLFRFGALVKAELDQSGQGNRRRRALMEP